MLVLLPTLFLSFSGDDTCKDKREKNNLFFRY